MKLYLITCSLFVLSAILIALDSFTNFEINHTTVYGAIQVILVSTLALLISNSKVKFKTIILVLIGTVGVFWYALSLFTWGGQWCTQTIIYQHKYNKNRTIELQMVDEGVFGYGRRTIDRIKLIPFFDWTEEIQEIEVDSSDWNKVNLEVNELGIKEI